MACIQFIKYTFVDVKTRKKKNLPRRGKKLTAAIKKSDAVSDVCDLMHVMDWSDV